MCSRGFGVHLEHLQRGSGNSTSLRFNTSGPPCRSMRIAFITGCPPVSWPSTTGQRRTASASSWHCSAPSSTGRRAGAGPPRSPAGPASYCAFAPRETPGRVPCRRAQWLCGLLEWAPHPVFTGNPSFLLQPTPGSCGLGPRVRLTRPAAPSHGIEGLPTRPLAGSSAASRRLGSRTETGRIGRAG